MCKGKSDEKKSENCLLASNGYLRLVDLGLAKRLKVPASWRHYKITNFVQYLACMLGKNTKKVDLEHRKIEKLCPILNSAIIRQDDEHSVFVELQNMSLLKSYYR